MFLANDSDGLAVVNIANPERPSIVRVIREVGVGGEIVELKVLDLVTTQDRLLVLLRGQPNLLFYDITRPSLPLLGYRSLRGVNGSLDRLILLDEEKLASLFGSSTPQISSIADSGNVFSLGDYDPRGFAIPGQAQSISGGQTVLSTMNVGKGKLPKTKSSYLNIFDASAPELVSVLDGVLLYDSQNTLLPQAMQQTEDGVVLISTRVVTGSGEVSNLQIVDTLVTDLVASIPQNGATGVELAQPLQLTLSTPLEIADGETAQAYLSRYLALIYEDGSADGQPVAIQLILSDDGRLITVTPDSALNPSADYRIELREEPASRRTAGLLDHEIEFSTASDSAPAPRIESIDEIFLLTAGGETRIVVENANDPVILIAGQAAAVLSSQALDATRTEYVLEAPSNFAGPASLRIENANGTWDQRIGAFQYVEPLEFSAITPAQGSINGGTSVVLKGRGFRTDVGDITVSFDDIEADPDTVRVIDPETIELITPRGRLGRADVTVRLADGQVRQLLDAFEYQQPVQSSIFDPIDKRRSPLVYDMAIDPTGTFLVTANGAAGIAIYNIDASTFQTGDGQDLNLDDLRQLIDLDGDGEDDRVLSNFALPDGYLALGVELFFERGYDRVLVTAAKPGEDASMLFVVHVDTADISDNVILKRLPLFTNLARGIEAENDSIALAMGEGGLGIIDGYLHSKLYLSQQLVLPGDANALDLDGIASAAGEARRFAIVAGEYDIGIESITECHRTRQRRLLHCREQYRRRSPRHRPTRPGRLAGACRRRLRLPRGGRRRPDHCRHLRTRCAAGGLAGHRTGSCARRRPQRRNRLSRAR